MLTGNTVVLFFRLKFFCLIDSGQFGLDYHLVVRAGRGFINKAQLGELMDTLGIDATAEEVDLMLSEIDLGKIRPV